MIFHLTLCILCLFISTDFDFTANAQETPFDQNYFSHWGGDHVTVLVQGREVQIKIDPSSGGGIKSKQAYSSGVFQLKIKMPQHSTGIVTTFYLTSLPDNGPTRDHSEMDFELLGHDEMPYTLNTNIFAEDSGNREQQFNLWFDPTTDFHEYKIVWNNFQIVFYIDEIPIRVYINYKRIGAKYPSSPMYVHATLWNASNWLGQVNWNLGPFYANYRNFTVSGCSSDTANCNSPKSIWNLPEFQKLDLKQKKIYEDMRKRSMTYDYCKSSPSNKFPECKFEK